MEYKKTLKCELCPENNPACLQFHHKDPTQKEFGIGSLIGSISIERLLAEIKKCSVLCANCHLKLHANEPKLKVVIAKRRNSRQRKSKCPPLEELEKVIWQKPIEQIALDYNVSDVSVHKWCRKYGIKKPPKGHWLKK